MAISEDTAALVAAQLTVAWATRTGPQKPDPARIPDKQVLETYERFKESVLIRSGGGYDLNSLT